MADFLKEKMQIFFLLGTSMLSEQNFQSVRLDGQKLSLKKQQQHNNDSTLWQRELYIIRVELSEGLKKPSV